MKMCHHTSLCVCLKFTHLVGFYLQDNQFANYAHLTLNSLQKIYHLLLLPRVCPCLLVTVGYDLLMFSTNWLNHIGTHTIFLSLLCGVLQSSFPTSSITLSFFLGQNSSNANSVLIENVHELTVWSHLLVVCFRSFIWDSAGETAIFLFCKILIAVN